jgi:hypothetical protein
VEVDVGEEQLLAIELDSVRDLWLANCYFAHDSSEFPVLRRFCDVQSDRANLAMGI